MRLAGGGGRLGPMLAVALAATGVALGVQATGALDRLQGQTIDARFALRGERKAKDVAVVAIDDNTFSELKLRWPFPRSLHARVIDRLRRAGARQVAYDVQFTEPTEPREDLALLDAVARARHAVLSTTEVDDRGRTNVLGGDEQLHRIGARAAHTGVVSDPGGVVRHLRYEVDGLATFPVATVEAATGRKVHRFRSSLIDFAGPPGAVPTLSFSRVLHGRFDPRLVRGRIVVVGASAPSLQDVHPASTSGDALMPGPELQANAISTVLHGLPLHEPAWWLDALCVALLALVAPLATWRFRPLTVIATSLGALGAYAGLALVLFGAGLVLPLVAPPAALVLGFLGALGLRLGTEARERRRTRELFGRFVPEPVVKELLESPDAAEVLGGRRLDGTVLFCDLRGFTAFAEGHPPERVVRVLNRYLSEMSGAILDHGGTVVSFMGDGIMGVFGTPIPREDHAQTGFDAAAEMLQVRLPRLNAWLREQGLPEFRLGVGLNSGPLMSGTVGSERRLEYAAIGDTTNVAARLETMTKETGGGLLVADSTRARLLRGAEELVRRGEIEVRGRAEPVEVWFLAAEGTEPEAVEEAVATA